MQALYVRKQSAMKLAAGVGLSSMFMHPSVQGQQNPSDPVIFHAGVNDSNGGTTSFNGAGGGWNTSTTAYSTADANGNYSNGLVSGAAPPVAANTAPQPNYAYVVTGTTASGSSGTSAGGQLRSPNSGSATFLGDSLTLIPVNGQPNLYNPSTTITNPADYSAGLFLKGPSGSVVTVGTPNATTGGLVLANGGAVLDFNNTDEILNGNIYLVPVGTTLDGITTTVDGGILDCRSAGSLSGADSLTVNSTFSGSGQLHLISTQNGAGPFGAIIFNNSSPSFSGTVNLDNTIPFASTSTVGSGSYPLLILNNPGALGSGIFMITSVGLGPTISNGSGAPETLSTNNPLQWNGSFQFGYNSSPNLATSSSPLDLGSGAVTLGGNVTVTANFSTLSVEGNISATGAYGLTKSGTATMNLGGGFIAVPLSVTAGTLNITAASAVITGPVTVAGGSLVLNSTTTNVSGGLTVTGGSVTIAGRALTTNGLSLAGGTGAWTGLIDIGKSHLDIQNGILATVTSQVTLGYNLAAGGTWQGSGGITSSAAAGDSTHLSAVGVIQNSVDGTPTGAALYGSRTPLGLFGGINPAASTDVLLKYTYYGDTDLSGAVDGTDYSRIDNGYLHGLSGWFNGDFNYDGVIDGSDYTLIDNAYNMQGTQLSAQIAESTAQVVGGAAVPEPTATGLLGISALGLIGRRRRY